MKLLRLHVCVIQTFQGHLLLYVHISGYILPLLVYSRLHPTIICAYLRLHPTFTCLSSVTPHYYCCPQLEDEQEKFERLQMELLMNDPDSTAYYNAQMRTHRRVWHDSRSLLVLVLQHFQH